MKLVSQLVRSGMKKKNPSHENFLLSSQEFYILFNRKQIQFDMNRFVGFVYIR